jgi:hypothetical protein
VTTRHLRRWEKAEAAAARPCSKPYTHADLWRLYRRRGSKGWDRPEATRLGLATVFERFDQMIPRNVTERPHDEHSVLAGLMLQNLALDEGEIIQGAAAPPRAFGSSIAKAAKTQLRMIVDCDQAREILVKAFFEAALIAEAKLLPRSTKAESDSSAGVDRRLLPKVSEGEWCPERDSNPQALTGSAF